MKVVIKKILKQTSLLLFSMLIGFVFLEILLYLAGFSLSVLQKKNLIGRNQEANDVIHILTIGESTTALIPPYSSWPAELEKILNSKQDTYRFVVINEAISATLAINIAIELPMYLDKYNPDIVITMMGINDKVFLFKYKEKFSQKVGMHFNKLDNYTPVGDDSYILGNRKIKSLKLVSYIYKRIYSVLKNRDNKENIMRLVEAGNLYKGGDSEGMEVKLKEILSNNKSFIPARTALAFLYASQGRLDEADRVGISSQIELGSPNNTNQTFEDYIKEVYHDVYSKTRAHGATLVAMQYPTLPINEIENFFTKDEKKDIYFISNELNFKKALKKIKYESIFYDSFGGTFGHTYLIGNQLIAENVANQILKIYSLNKE